MDMPWKEEAYRSRSGEGHRETGQKKMMMRMHVNCLLFGVNEKTDWLAEGSKLGLAFWSQLIKSWSSYLYSICFPPDDQCGKIINSFIIKEVFSYWKNH